MYYNPNMPDVELCALCNSIQANHVEVEYFIGMQSGTYLFLTYDIFS